MNEQKLAYSIKECAALTGWSEKTIRRLIARGKLRACRVTRHLRVPAAELQALFNK